MITPSENERLEGRFEESTLAKAMEEFSTVGYVVVENLISKESCERLSQAVVEDAERIRDAGEKTMHEKHTGQGHLQLGLPRNAPYVRADLLANPLIECIVASILGENAWLGFYNGNVNLPGSVNQPLHFDRPYGWRTEGAARAAGENWPPRTITLSCSVALVDITVENGATEIYPGSHHETEVASWPLGERLSNHPELIEKWGPPGRMAIPAGGICFRDPRMWHRGVANTSDVIRPMIGLTYHADVARHWRGLIVPEMTPEDVNACKNEASLRVMDDKALGDGRLVFQDDTASVFSDNPTRHQINRNVRFVSPPSRVDHTVDAHLVGGARVIEETGG